jgi:hypothetical protein
MNAEEELVEITQMVEGLNVRADRISELIGTIKAQVTELQELVPRALKASDAS